MKIRSGGLNLSDIIKIALPYGDYEKKMFEILDFAVLHHNSNSNVEKKNIERGICVYSVNHLDIITCVERGAVDIGIISTDILMEHRSKVLELMDFNLEKLYIGVIAKNNFVDDISKALRVATKYPNIAMDYFLTQCRDIDIIKMHDFPEMSLNIDMADVVLDVLESENILKKNDLQVIDVIKNVGFHLISNSSSFHFKNNSIEKFINRLKLNVDRML